MVIFIASHLGYPMERTPLGGGAMVGLELARHWDAAGEDGIVLLGSGPVPPSRRLEYHRLAPVERGLVGLSEREYARFCRRFESEATSWLIGRRQRFPPESTCVLVNDISEGPNLAALRAAGYPVVSIWHVDVVDYFNKMYLGRLLAPESLTRAVERWGLSRWLPDLLRLVFEKQQLTVRQSRAMIFPSRAMADTVRRCYGPEDEALVARCRVIPWGVWDDGVDAAAAEARAAELRRHYQIGPETRTLLTLSRISPEKGLHLLLEALALVEDELPFDLCVFVSGEPAFMQGTAYLKRVRAAAARLRRARVFFPGYLSALDKRGFFAAADLFVSPSVHESYGLNVVEAMRAGVAVLASDHYGVRDLLSPSFGRSVPVEPRSGAAERFAAALRELLPDRAALRRMGESARAAAEGMPFSRAAEAVLAEARAAAGAEAAAR